MRIFWQWLLLLSFFFIDICMLGALGFPFLQSVLCFTIVTFLYYSCGPLFYGSFLLLGFESFAAFDLFGITALYLVPLFTIFSMIRRYLSSKEMTAIIMLILALYCHNAFLVFFKLDQPALGRYTLYQIGANLIVLFISLKWFSTVEQGNRFEL